MQVEPRTADRLVLTGAVALLADGEAAGDVLVEAGVVAAIGEAASRADAPRIDVSGCVVTPGLVNAHHHLLQSAFRTLPGTRAVSMRDWLGVMGAAYAGVGVDPELASAAASVGVAEGLLSGVTTVADHWLTWPAGVDDVGVAHAVAAEAARLGGRLVLVRGSARDDPDEAAASADRIAEALVGDAAGGVAGDGMLQVAVGPAGVHSDGEATFRALGEVAARRGLRRRTQANEQVDVEVAAARWGRRPLDLLEEWGWVADDVTIAHCCAVMAAEVARLAAAGATVTHAPGCDVPMGWGVAPVGTLLDAGIEVGLGTSGGGSNDAGHLLADARLAMQVSPLGGRALAAREVLRMATAGSALGLGRQDLGRIEVGAAADLAVWDVSGVADAGVADPVAGLLWASPGRRPRDVLVAGRPVVADGVLVRADERALARGLARLLAARAG